MGNDNFEGKPSGSAVHGRAALVPLQAGCLTFFLAMVAILIGLWLDLRLGTSPRWMLILLIGSAPFALGGVYFLVRRSLRRMRVEQETHTPDEAGDQR